MPEVIRDTEQRGHGRHGAIILTDPGALLQT